MRAVSLFSGCGGLDLGAVRAGAQIEFVNDIDREALAAHKRILEVGVVSETSISDIETLPAAELWLAGYPCQSFSDAGPRRPDLDPRSRLFSEFVRLLGKGKPEFFVVENVPGLARRAGGRLLLEQLQAFSRAGYELATRVLRAEEYGVPQRRRRLIIVGVRRDLGAHYWFPGPSHGAVGTGLTPLVAHGDVIADLPLWPEGEFYEHAVEDHNFPAYYLSRNRKADWFGPANTVLASWRHAALHPASPDMVRVRTVDRDRNWQTWDFADSHAHLLINPKLPSLDRARRISVREAARIQGLPDEVADHSSARVAFRYIGNAVPPALASAVIGPIIDGSGLRTERSSDAVLATQLRSGQIRAVAGPKPISVA